MQNFIIGGGPVGLIAAYFTGYTIIDSEIGGQFNSQGPYYFHNTKNSRKLLKLLNVKYEVKKCKIGYFDGDKEVKYSEEFKKRYFFKTRGDKNVYGSSLNNGKSEFEYLDFDYKEFKRVILKKVKVIKDSVIKIAATQKLLTLEKDNKKIPYDNLISTININILFKLLNTQYKYQSKSKLMVETSNPIYYMKYNLSTYDYVYVINKDYDRVIKIKDSANCILDFNVANELQIVHILDRYHSKKFNLLKCCTIVENIGRVSVSGIKLLGRYAQWNHKIKMNDIIDGFMEGK